MRSSLANSSETCTRMGGRGRRGFRRGRGLGQSGQVLLQGRETGHAGLRCHGDSIFPGGWAATSYPPANLSGQNRVQINTRSSRFPAPLAESVPFRMHNGAGVAAHSALRELPVAGYSLPASTGRFISFPTSSKRGAIPGESAPLLPRAGRLLTENVRVQRLLPLGNVNPGNGLRACPVPASSYRTNSYPSGYSKSRPKRLTLELLWFLRTLPHAPIHICCLRAHPLLCRCGQWQACPSGKVPCQSCVSRCLPEESAAPGSQAPSRAASSRTCRRPFAPARPWPFAGLPGRPSGASTGRQLHVAPQAQAWRSSGRTATADRPFPSGS